MPLIIFDFDGTLADTQSSIVETFHATMDRMGRPRISDEAIRSVIGLPLKQNFTVAAGFSDAEADEAVIIYRELFDEIAHRSVVLFPGVLETVRTLFERGVPMAVASSRSERSLHDLLGLLGLDQYLTHIYGTGSVEHGKPAPDMVLLILDEMKADPKQTLVIGDTSFDIEMGSAAGCYTCAVTYGNQSLEQLSASKPNYIINDLREIL